MTIHYLEDERACIAQRDLIPRRKYTGNDTPCSGFEFGGLAKLPIGSTSIATA